MLILLSFFHAPGAKPRPPRSRHKDCVRLSVVLFIAEQPGRYSVREQGLTAGFVSVDYLRRAPTAREPSRSWEKESNQPTRQQPGHSKPWGRGFCSQQTRWRPEPSFNQEAREGNDRDNVRTVARPNLQSILRAVATGPTEVKKILGLDATSEWAGNSFSFPLSVIESDGFVDGLDALREEVSKAALLDKTMVASTVAVSSGLSVGNVVWLIRGGVLMSTVLSCLARLAPHRPAAGAGLPGRRG